MGFFDSWLPKSEEGKPEPKGGGIVPVKKQPLDIFAPTEGTPSLMDFMAPERSGIYQEERPTFEGVPLLRPEAPRSSIRKPFWNLPSPEELSRRLEQIFDLRQIFEVARGASRRGRALATTLVPVASVDDYDTLAAFFGIPGSVIDAYVLVAPELEVEAQAALWDEVFWPLFDMTTAAFEILKTGDLSGWFQLNLGLQDSRIIELQYIETI